MIGMYSIPNLHQLLRMQASKFGVPASSNGVRLLNGGLGTLVSVTKCQDGFTMETCLCGLSKDQIKVIVTGDGSVLKIETTPGDDQKMMVLGHYFDHLTDSRCASYSLPDNHQVESVSYANGVLTVRLKQTKEEETADIDIEISG